MKIAYPVLEGMGRAMSGGMGGAERRSNDVMSSIFCVRQTRYVDTAGLGEYYLNHSDTNHEAYEIYKTDHRRITEWRITGGYLATMR